MNAPRFNLPAPMPSLGDRLLDSAVRLKTDLWRLNLERDDDLLDLPTIDIEITATVTADPAGLAMLRELVRRVAKGGDHA